MKKWLLLPWYLVGFICVIPAVLWLYVSHVSGLGSQKATKDDKSV
jgi:hypothetical protein